MSYSYRGNFKKRGNSTNRGSFANRGKSRVSKRPRNRDYDENLSPEEYQKRKFAKKVKSDDEIRKFEAENGPSFVAQIFKKSLEEISTLEYQQFKQKVFEFQLTNNLLIVNTKCKHIEDNRTIEIRVHSKND